MDEGSRTLTGAAFQKPQRTDELLGRGANAVRPNILRLVIEIYGFYEHWGPAVKAQTRL